jgi:hypothetical protein
MDNSLKTVEDLIQAGLSERFYKVFGVPLLFYNGPDVKTIAAKMLDQRNLPAYPFAVAKVQTYAMSEMTYKANTLLRRGLMGSSSHDHVLCYELNMIPVTTTYEVALYVQDFLGLRNLSKAWLLASTRNNLKFTITYAVRDIDIHINMEKSLNIPTREGGATEVKEYLMTTNMIVFGYMGDQLKTHQAVTDLEVQCTLLAEGAQTGQSFTLFTKGWPYESGTTGADLTADTATFTLDQNAPATMWIVKHDLNKFPKATVMNEQGTIVKAMIHYPSVNMAVLQFQNLTAGRALLQ